MHIRQNNQKHIQVKESEQTAIHITFHNTNHGALQ